MSSSSEQSSGGVGAAGGKVFEPTRWSVVLKAGSSDTTGAEEALATLCQTYWKPLYGYVRRRGYRKAEAEDMVQGFFAAFIGGKSLRAVNPEGGRFRAYLLASIKHFMANEWDRAHRQKRGGHATHFSLDWKSAEDRCVIDPTDDESPDRVFDREWASTLLDRVLERLEGEMKGEGKIELWSELKTCLTVGSEEIGYGEMAESLGMTVEAVRVAVHRLRKRYRSLVREEIAEME